MPMPWAYRHATKDFRTFLDDVKARADLISDNSVYTALGAVFQVFRRRLSVDEGLLFASVLTAVLSAILFRHWQPADEPAPFGTRQEMNAEVQEIRKHHNLTPRGPHRGRCLVLVAALQPPRLRDRSVQAARWRAGFLDCRGRRSRRIGAADKLSGRRRARQPAFFFRPPFFLPAFSAMRSTAISIVTASGSVSFGRVALTFSHFT